MKKRLLCLALVLCLALGMVPAVSALNNDTIAFYLTPYEVQSGDTVTSILGARGLKPADYADIIRNVNGLANLNMLIVGRTYWMPALTVGGSKTYYTVYRHTVVSGDTVDALCTLYNVSLSKSTSIIKSVNGVTDLASFQVGTALYLPVYTDTGAASTGTTSTGTTAGTAASTGTTAGTATTVVNPDGTTSTATTWNGTTAPGLAVAEKDHVAFYMTPYQVQPGDTVFAICKARKVTYTDAKDVVVGINKMSAVNNLIANRTYYMPSTSVGNATTYYEIISHRLVTGDTVSGLCTQYKLNINKVSDLILKINNVKSLVGFKAGNIIYLPIYHEGSASGTGTNTNNGLPTNASSAGTTATTSTSTSVDNKDGTTTTTTTTVTTSTTEGADLFDATKADTFYLVPYTVKEGDNLVSICNGLGTSFTKNSTLIATANGLGSYTGLAVGAKVWIPAKTAGSLTSGYYIVNRHTMKAGENLYSLVTAAGGDFNKSYQMLSTLNGSSTLNLLYVDDVVLVPAYKA